MSRTHAYIGIKECGCVVAACVDDDPETVADALSEFAESGLTIEHVTIDDCRLRLTGCKCLPTSGRPKAMSESFDIAGLVSGFKTAMDQWVIYASEADHDLATAADPEGILFRELKARIVAFEISRMTGNKEVTI